MSESEEPKDMEEFIVEGVLMLGVSIAGVILNIIRSLFIILNQLRPGQDHVCLAANQTFTN